MVAVLTWRNNPEIRRYMLSSAEIDFATHQRWYASARSDPGRRLLIVDAPEAPLGFVQFHKVSLGAASDWGFYAVPGAPKGSGRRLGEAALNHAFRILELHKVCGQALGFNTGSIRMHETLGFKREGVLREQHLVNGLYQNLVCFGLLRCEWEKREG